MAWTNPLTWNVGHALTAALFNLHIRDNFNALSGHTHTGTAGDGSAALAPTSITMGAGMLQESKGADIASANNLPLGATSDGNLFNITGTTTIIQITGKQPGTRIILRLNSAVTIQHGAGIIVLQGGGNWAAPAGSMIELVCYALQGSGSAGFGHWIEVTRWVGGTIPKGNIWLAPSSVDGADPNLVIDALTYTPRVVFTATTSIHFQFIVPADFSALVSARAYQYGGSLTSTDISGSLSSTTPGTLCTYAGGTGNWVGVAIAYTA